jgi:hypothetical protein
MFFGTWKPDVAQLPRQNTMYQTPLDTRTLTWPRTYCKSGWSLQYAAMNVMFVTTPYAAGEVLVTRVRSRSSDGVH